MPGHTGIARAIVSKSRKPRGATSRGFSSPASVGSTMIRFSAIALSWRRWVKLSFSFAGNSPTDDDAARQVGRGALRPDAGEVPDVVRRIGPAAAHERALVRLEAVQAHRDVGKRPGEHLPLPINFVWDSRKKLYDRSRHIGPDEQVARGGMPELLVQVQHGSGRDRHVAGRR